MLRSAPINRSFTFITGGVFHVPSRIDGGLVSGTARFVRQGIQLPQVSVADSQTRLPAQGRRASARPEYKEKGNINTPLEVALLNETCRFHLVIDVIDRVSALLAKAGHLRDGDGRGDTRRPCVVNGAGRP
jgi:hypothetical protein